ncbi:hypothetical protein EMPS_11632 [Entomortierella parvispora]|uniref:Uncharacterized protein n=1 Tax=Entomortierella parvispora TaxID=205924 RepID=A0A9P3M248_9FUNG|nr:hypothetical protein EMPS_11632 [Entomortierella parvispora]
MSSTSPRTGLKDKEPWFSDNTFSYLLAHKATLNPSDFFTSLQYTDKRIAHKDYGRAISCFRIFNTARQTVLAADFERWKIEKSQQFWAEVLKSKTTVLSLSLTETSLIRNATPLANNTIEEWSRRTMERRSGHMERLDNKQDMPSPDLNVHSKPMDVSELDIDASVVGIQRQQRQTTEQPTTLSTTPTGSPPPSSLFVTESVTPTTITPTIKERAPAIEEPLLDDDEREILLRSVEEASHRQCEWMVDSTCAACLFQDFQRKCIDALVRNEIKKTEVADAMALIGVFAPSMPTTRMKTVFSEKLLHVIAKPTVDLPDTGLDDGAMMTAVKLYIKGQKEDAADILYALNKKDRKIRLMLETLLEYLPLKPDNTISENTFVTKYVAPIIQSFVDDEIVKSDFPNTESTTQKSQGLKPDRPDIRAVAYGKEVCWGEVTGPSQETFDAKNQWDTYRLARFGKSFLDAGNNVAPLLQIVYSNASYLRLFPKTRGIFLLEEVGTFIIPTTIAMIPSLFATIPTLLVAKADIRKICEGDLNGLKRSWGYKDLKNAKTRLV